MSSVTEASSYRKEDVDARPVTQYGNTGSTYGRVPTRDCTNATTPARMSIYLPCILGLANLPNLVKQPKTFLLTVALHTPVRLRSQCLLITPFPPIARKKDTGSRRMNE